MWKTYYLCKNVKCSGVLTLDNMISPEGCVCPECGHVGPVSIIKVRPVEEED